MKKSTKWLVGLLVLACCVLVIAAFLVLQERNKDKPDALEEYRADVRQIKSLRQSLQPGPTNDLDTYERFAQGMIKKWSQRRKDYFARMINELCGPLSSGRFDENRQQAVAREYAMLALADANEIPLETELELTGHVVTSMYTPNAPKGQDFAQRRKKDAEVRLHAWKRLVDAIDPNWDPNEALLSPNAVAIELGLPGAGMAPESVRDAKLRAEYEAALEKNRQQIQRHTEQYKLQDWLKRYPKRAERYIILAYSEPPFHLEELKRYLDRYIPDEKTKARIVHAVETNIEKETAKMEKCSQHQTR